MGFNLEVLAAASPFRCTYFGHFPGAIFRGDQQTMRKANENGFITRSMARKLMYDPEFDSPRDRNKDFDIMLGEWCEDDRTIVVSPWELGPAPDHYPQAKVTFQRALRKLSTMKVSVAQWTGYSLAFQVTFTDEVGQANWQLFPSGEKIVWCDDPNQFFYGEMTHVDGPYKDCKDWERFEEDGERWMKVRKSPER